MVYFLLFLVGVSLYHHFCDFYNLYASLHANNTFNDDVTVVMWDTVSVNVIYLLATI